jgi:putative ABC transport system ATP-binding protein
MFGRQRWRSTGASDGADMEAPWEGDVLEFDTATAATSTPAVGEPPPPPAVELTHVTKRYRRGRVEVLALDDASLQVGQGELVAVTGPSGAGKSTLLHVAGSLLAPDEGEVRIMGELLNGGSDARHAEIRRRHVGFVFQFFNLLPNLRAWENVALPGVLDGGRISAFRHRAVELLDRFGMGDEVDASPNELSGGQMQRLAIARALLLRPSLVLADEPTGNLDRSTGAGVLAALREVVDDDGLAVVVVTHDAQAASVADRRIEVVDGLAIPRPS